MAIKIKGVIGWDVIGTSFADMFSRLSGDVDIEIDSPGGSVFDGISIFNAIKNYNKGKCNIRVVGECSSMAAYIMLAGDSLKFEENSIVVLHNPWNCCCGDYNVMKRNADILERLSVLYASEFVRQGIFEEQAIRSIMDAETWFIGSTELAKLGEVVKSSDDSKEPQDVEIAIAAARENIKSWQARFRQEMDNDVDRIAALLPSKPQAKAEKEADSAQTQQTSSKVINTVKNEKEKEIMDINELKSSNPDVFAQATNLGVEQEKKRVNALMNFIDVDKDAVIKAINEGKSIQDDEVQSAILMAKIKTQTINAMEGDNAPGINPAEPPHAPESETEVKEKAKKDADEAEAKNLDKVLAHLGYDA